MFFIKSVGRVCKHKTQSYRESCLFHFSHFELYFALHSCVLSTFQQHLLQFPTIISHIVDLASIFAPFQNKVMSIKLSHNWRRLRATSFSVKSVVQVENKSVKNTNKQTNDVSALCLTPRVLHCALTFFFFWLISFVTRATDFTKKQGLIVVYSRRHMES